MISMIFPALDGDGSSFASVTYDSSFRSSSSGSAVSACRHHVSNNVCPQAAVNEPTCAPSVWFEVAFRGLQLALKGANVPCLSHVRFPDAGFTKSNDRDGGAKPSALGPEAE